MARIPQQDFLYGQRIMRVISSNVASASYDDEENFLTITYKNGRSYVYAKVTELEARSFWYATSKGSWIWTYLRVRGSRTLHQKSYWLLDI